MSEVPLYPASRYLEVISCRVVKGGCERLAVKSFDAIAGAMSPHFSQRCVCWLVRFVRVVSTKRELAA